MYARAVSGACLRPQCLIAWLCLRMSLRTQTCFQGRIQRIQVGWRVVDGGTSQTVLNLCTLQPETTRRGRGNNTTDTPGESLPIFILVLGLTRVIERECHHIRMFLHWRAVFSCSCGVCGCSYLLGAKNTRSFSSWQSIHVCVRAEYARCMVCACRVRFVPKSWSVAHRVISP